jgi:hypothetical protein
MQPHPMPDRGTYKCGDCGQDHRVLDHDWLIEVGFTEDEAQSILKQSQNQALSYARPNAPKTHAERQAEYRTRKAARQAENRLKREFIDAP